jgi:short-subunit dehydrogenase
MHNMKRVILWNLSQNQAEELQGQAITVTTDNPDFVAEQMMRNRNTQEYETRVEDIEPDHDLDI